MKTFGFTYKEQKLSKLRNVLEGCSLSAALLGFYSLFLYCYKDRNLCVQLNTLLNDRCRCLFFLIVVQFSDLWSKMFYLSETLLPYYLKNISFPVPCDT